MVSKEALPIKGTDEDDDVLSQSPASGDPDTATNLDSSQTIIEPAGPTATEQKVHHDKEWMEKGWKAPVTDPVTNKKLSINEMFVQADRVRLPNDPHEEEYQKRKLLQQIEKIKLSADEDPRVERLQRLARREARRQLDLKQIEQGTMPAESAKEWYETLTSAIKEGYLPPQIEDAWKETAAQLEEKYELKPPRPLFNKETLMNNEEARKGVISKFAELFEAKEPPQALEAARMAIQLNRLDIRIGPTIQKRLLEGLKKYQSGDALAELEYLACLKSLKIKTIEPRSDEEMRLSSRLQEFRRNTERATSGTSGTSFLLLNYYSRYLKLGKFNDKEKTDMQNGVRERYQKAADTKHRELQLAYELRLLQQMGIESPFKPKEETLIEEATKQQAETYYRQDPRRYTRLAVLTGEVTHPKVTRNEQFRNQVKTYTKEGKWEALAAYGADLQQVEKMAKKKTVAPRPETKPTEQKRGLFGRIFDRIKGGKKSRVEEIMSERQRQGFNNWLEDPTTIS